MLPYPRVLPSFLIKILSRQSRRLIKGGAPKMQPLKMRVKLKNRISQSPLKVAFFLGMWPVFTGDSASLAFVTGPLGRDYNIEHKARSIPMSRGVNSKNGGHISRAGPMAKILQYVPFTCSYFRDRKNIRWRRRR